MDYPTASNGKRNRFWGTLRVCPDCGRCLCFACHPQGPCLDQREGMARASAPAQVVTYSAYNAEKSA